MLLLTFLKQLLNKNDDGFLAFIQDISLSTIDLLAVGATAAWTNGQSLKVLS